MTATKALTPIDWLIDPPPARVDPAVEAATKSNSIESATAISNRDQGHGKHDQQGQAETHLDFARDRRSMRQRLRHGDADRVLKRRVAVEPMGGGLPKPGPVPEREHRRVSRVRLKQDAPFGIPHEVGKELVVFPDRGEPLRDPLIFPTDDVGHGQRQDPLRHFAQRAVEDLVHLAPDDHGCDRRGQKPQDRQHEAQRQTEAR